ncbi:DUF2325 domain-containing protein [Comamonas antarctica]|uniref:DUF2325 domain-containing protein n=1 Tax=Comamonas antarctica TaxID=2743470 RepID=UPI0028EAF136|nr:DUF2325 domain-containing protein [Comamonas antarctica]
MTLAAPPYQQLTGEYQVLMRHYGQTQMRCDALVRAQAAEIERLQGMAMRLRAAVIVRDTALAWERAQRSQAVLICMQNLARERLQWQWAQLRAAAQGGPGEGGGADDAGALAASAEAADLVVCQTGCLSHGDYWRVQDQCRRTGQTCVLVEQSAAASIDGFGADAPAQRLVEWLPAPENTAS